MSAWLLGACVVAAAEFGSGITQSTCKHTCASANDGACDDGGLGATSDRCDYGTDCAGGALPSYADTPTNPLPHHATYTMRTLTPVNVRPLLPNADCGARDNFECSGPRDAGELRAALLGPGSGYDKQTRPKVALKRAQSSAGAGFWPPERDEAWAQLRILSIDNVDTKTQKVGLATAALIAALTASLFITTTSSFTITSTITSTTFLSTITSTTLTAALAGDAAGVPQRDLVRLEAELQHHSHRGMHVNAQVQSPCGRGRRRSRRSQ